MTIAISGAALRAAADETKGEVELRSIDNLVDARVGALAAVNAERSAGFPNGRLFLHSIEQVLAVALVNGYVVGLSTAHFSQMFRKSTGETPHQFVLRVRVERAKEMLRSAEMRVLDVAIACGFKTQQHFARVFRQMCGASPMEYRYQSLR